MPLRKLPVRTRALPAANPASGHSPFCQGVKDGDHEKLAGRGQHRWIPPRCLCQQIFFRIPLRTQIAKRLKTVKLSHKSAAERKVLI